MVNQVSKLELVILSFNTTVYTIVKALTPNSPFINESNIKGTSYFIMMLINFDLSDVIFDHLIKTPFYLVTVLTLGITTINVLIDAVYKKKIAFIAENYFAYYNIVVPLFFGALSVGGLVYLFMYA